MSVLAPNPAVRDDPAGNRRAVRRPRGRRAAPLVALAQPHGVAPLRSGARSGVASSHRGRSCRPRGPSLRWPPPTVNSAVPIPGRYATGSAIMLQRALARGTPSPVRGRWS